MRMPEAAIVRAPISLDNISSMAQSSFGDMVKAVVDIGRGVMAIGGELHADEEALLLSDGARQSDLWGINLYPAEHGTPGWIEYDSMINVRPAQGNRSRSVEDATVREQVAMTVDQLVTK